MIIAYIETYTNLIPLVNMLGRDIYVRNFVKIIINTGLRPDAYEFISFKLGMVINTAEL